MNLRRKLDINRRFTSTSPGSDWFALYDDGEIIAFVPIIVWATYVDSDNMSGVTGMIREPDYADLCEADCLPHFQNYMHISEIRATAEKYRDAKNVPTFSSAAN